MTTVLVGSTKHFRLYYDSTVTNLAAAAKTFFEVIEQDYNRTFGLFTGVTYPTHLVDVHLRQHTSGDPGATWDYDTLALTIYLNTTSVAWLSGQIRFLFVAELSEQFMWLQKRGWFEGDGLGGNEGSIGEGLSMVCATENAKAFDDQNAIGGFYSGDWPNTWFANNEPDGLNHDSLDYGEFGSDGLTGCAVVFIYWMMHKGYSLKQIIAADPGPHLRTTYQKLTGSSADPFPLMKAEMDAKYPSKEVPIDAPETQNPWGTTPKIQYRWPGTSTHHFQIVYDPSLGAYGEVLADSLVDSIEADLSLLQGWWSGATYPTDGVKICLDDNNNPNSPMYHQGGAAWGGSWSHYETHVAIDISDGSNPTQFKVARGKIVCEVMEHFEYIQKQGWAPGATNPNGNEGSNGEALSLIAEKEYGRIVKDPRVLHGTPWANFWLNSPRADYVNHTDANFFNGPYNETLGCGVLFLNWLRYQYGFTMKQICTAAAPTLGGVYKKLTGKTNDPFPAFLAQLDQKFPRGTPVDLSGYLDDYNPYPIATVVPPTSKNGDWPLYYQTALIAGAGPSAPVAPRNTGKTEEAVFRNGQWVEFWSQAHAITDPVPVADFTYSQSAASVASTDTSTGIVTFSDGTQTATTTTSTYTVSFNGLASFEVGGRIVAWDWTFGDGTTGSGSTINHTYSGAQTVSVRLTVTDALGKTASITKAVTISGSPTSTPVANFTPSVNGYTVSFDGTKSSSTNGASIVAWNWTFGDGGVGTGPTTSHTYQGGSYAVTLTVTDSYQKTAKSTVTVKTNNSVPVPSFTANATGLRLDVDGSGSVDPDGTILTYDWAWGDGTSSSGAQASVVPNWDHIIYVWMENHSETQIMGNSSAPYINSLAGANANFVKAVAEAHPSLPNYLAGFAGSTMGVTDDAVHDLSGPNLYTQMKAAGLSFKGYSEGLPSVGYTGATSGGYVRKHAPWVSFQANGYFDGANHVPFSAFPTDYTTLPDVCWVVPNLTNDMHDGTVAQGDTWLKTHIDPVVQWAKTHNSVVILVWDEDDSSTTNGNDIPLIIAGANVKPGTYSQVVNHYDLLGLIQDSCSLARLNGSVSKPGMTYVASAPGGVVATATHTYAAAGTYTVALTVGDNSGVQQATSKIVTLSQPAASYISGAATASSTLVTGSSAATLQDLVRSPDTGEFYSSQVHTETNGDESVRISRSAAGGAYIDNMLLTDAGHGTSFALEYTGGKVYVWLNWRKATDGATDVFDLVRFPYAAGTFTRSQVVGLTVKIAGPTYRLVGFDSGGDYAVIRVASGTSDQYKRYPLANVMAGSLTGQSGVTITLPQSTNSGDDNNPTLQGFATYYDSLFRYTGLRNDAANYSIDKPKITEYSWTTGKAVKTLDVSGFGSSFSLREPEGLSIYNTGTNPVLFFAMSTGPTGGPHTFPTWWYPLYNPDSVGGPPPPPPPTGNTVKSPWLNGNETEGLPSTVRVVKWADLATSSSDNNNPNVALARLTSNAVVDISGEQLTIPSFGLNSGYPTGLSARYFQGFIGGINNGVFDNQVTLKPNVMTSAQLSSIKAQVLYNTCTFAVVRPGGNLYGTGAASYFMGVHFVGADQGRIDEANSGYQYQATPSRYKGLDLDKSGPGSIFQNCLLQGFNAANGSSPPFEVGMVDMLRTTNFITRRVELDGRLPIGSPSRPTSSSVDPYGHGWKRSGGYQWNADKQPHMYDFSIHSGLVSGLTYSIAGTSNNGSNNTADIYVRNLYVEDQSTKGFSGINFEDVLSSVYIENGTFKMNGSGGYHLKFNPYLQGVAAPDIPTSKFRVIEPTWSGLGFNGMFAIGIAKWGTYQKSAPSVIKNGVNLIGTTSTTADPTRYYHIHPL
jgi:PKD repeat protein